MTILPLIAAALAGALALAIVPYVARTKVAPEQVRVLTIGEDEALTAYARGIVQERKTMDGALLPILHALNDAFGYVDASVVPVIAEELNLSRAEVHGVISFYHDFRKDPPGEHVDRLVDHVMSGGVSINDALLHVGQHDLPFGGIGESGMGHYHGREGFETFSKLRPVFHQARLSSVGLLAPPYGRLADRMLAFLTR